MKKNIVATSRKLCAMIFYTWRKNLQKLENVAIENALQLEATRATPVLFRFNFNAMPSLKSLNLSLAVL